MPLLAMRLWKYIEVCIRLSNNTNTNKLELNLVRNRNMVVKLERGFKAAVSINWY